MATPKDKFSKALDQKAHTQTSVTAQQRSPWEEALNRYVSVPASRSVEAAEVFKGFSGSWAGDYELGMGASGESGNPGVPAFQRKTNRLGQPGVPEVNFRPYDWGTHRFGPKGPSLLGHPISFSVVGPTLKTPSCDWQWALTDNSGTANGDVLTLDMEGLDDISVASQPAGSGVVQTAVQVVKGGPTTLEDYYGFTDLSTFSNSGLYLVVSMSGSAGAMDNPSGVGGVGDGVVADPTGPTVRIGVTPITAASKTEIFRIVAMDNAAKSFTLDPVKHIADFFTVTGSAPVIQAVMLIKPEATRLVAVPGSGAVGAEQTFAILPPERALTDDYNPPYLLYTDSGAAGAFDPWTGYSYSDPALTGETDPAHNYPVRPLLPIDEPLWTTTAIQPGSFNGAVAPVSILGAHRLLLPLDAGNRPDVGFTWGRLCRIFEVEFYGDANTYTAGEGPSWVADPGYEWLLGYHEVFLEDASTEVEGVGLIRTTEVNPVTGVPFYTPPDALEPAYPAAANNGIRWKVSFHDPVRRVWEDPHASIDKISRTRLTNLINPDWVSLSRSLKQQQATPAFTHAVPDKAVFDTSSSNSGASGSNADPGNLMDLGFRVVLYPAIDGGAGHLVPDFNNPISNRQCRLDPAVDEDQYWDIDYSNGLVTLSHPPASGGDLTPNGVVGPLVVSALTATSLSFASSAGAGTDTITRASGSWVTDGVEIGHRGTISNAGTAANNGEFQVTNVTPTVLTIASLALTSGTPFTHPLTTDAGDTDAVVTFGNNRRREVVLFASCVPYSREAGQLGSGIRVTGGRSKSAISCGTVAHGDADVFGGRRFWRLAGSNASPQVITSASSGIQINLEPLVLGTSIPAHGFIEIIKGLSPEGEPALFDTERNSFSTFGFTFDNTTHGGGGTALTNCFGGTQAGGAAAITVDDDNPYIAVLRRDVVTPNFGDGSVGTDYAHDLTYGSAFRASSIRFKHAVLTTQVDGSVVVEGLEELAGEHELLFKDLFTSTVVEGFEITAGSNRDVNIAAGVVLIDGVRSEIAASTVSLPAPIADYYIYIEPLNGDPACPGFNYQIGLPLVESNHVLVGYATHNGSIITEMVQLQNKVQDINLRDDILVGAPSGGQPNFGSVHPHFTELADAVDYACELTKYRTTHSASTDAFGDRFIKIKVIGPTTEQAAKLPIRFTASGIIIEGAGVHTEGTHLVGATTANNLAVSWSTNSHLFDLNGQSHLVFKNLVFEYRDTLGLAAVTDFKMSVFHQGTDLDTSFINIDNCHLVWNGDNEAASGPPPNMAQAFVHVVAGSHSSWRISNCSAVTSDAGVYFGGENTGSAVVVDNLDNIVIEGCTFQSLWRTTLSNGVGSVGAVTGLVGINEAGPEIEPEPYGAIILVSAVQTKNCVVRGNVLQYWSGFGIFDNGADGCLYDNNILDELGDIAIWSGCNFTLYDRGSGRAAGYGTRIVNNIVRNAHDFPSTGGAGFETQTEIAANAGVPIVSNPEKRAIVVSFGSEDVVVANNWVSIESGAADDASIYLDASVGTVVLGNHCLEGVKINSLATVISVGDNRIVGDVLGDGGSVAWTTNYIGGDADLTGGTDQIFSKNEVAGSFLGTGARGIVSGNSFTATTPSGDASFGATSIITDNYSAATSTSWLFLGNTVVAGNAAVGLDFESLASSQCIANNFMRSWLATVSGNLQYLVISGNYVAEGLLFNDTSGNLQFSLIANNSVGVGGIVLDNSQATQAHSHNAIVGNALIGGDLLYAGGEHNIISSNVLTSSAGYMTLGSATQPSHFARSIVSNNIVSGRQALDNVPDTGVAGVHQFDVSILIAGASSNRNSITGNVCEGGLIMRTGSDYSVLANNVFESATHNPSVWVVGDHCAITGNLVQSTVVEDILLQSDGDGSTVTGNTVVKGALWNTGTAASISGNYTSSVTGILFTLYNTGASCSITGNTTDSGDAQITVAGAWCTFSGNHINGALDVDAAECSISGNQIGPNKGIVTLTGAACTFSGNRVEAAVTVTGDNCSITGNIAKTNIGISGAGAAVSGNRTITFSNNSTGTEMVATGNIVTGTFTLKADNCVLMGNRIEGDLTTDHLVDDATNYVIMGNAVVGDILTAGASTGTGRGILIGNYANQITPTLTLPLLQMVVLGNRVTGTSTDIFGVDPGTDSVGVAASASDIVNFNVGG